LDAETIALVRELLSGYMPLAGENAPCPVQQRALDWIAAHEGSKHEHIAAYCTECGEEFSTSEEAEKHVVSHQDHPDTERLRWIAGNCNILTPRHMMQYLGWPYGDLEALRSAIDKMGGAK
jgi:hypothetical protein